MLRKKINFLASYPKSGNTWCRSFLSNYIQEKETPVDINNLQNGTSVGIISSRNTIDNLFGIESSILTEREVADLKKEALFKLNKELKKQTYIKVHDSFPLKNELDWFPSEVTAGVIYIVRNPLDIVKSFSNHQNTTIDKTIENMNNTGFGLCMNRMKLIHQFPQILHTWSEHVESWLDGYKGDLCLIRYEDMQTNPFKTFGKIIRSLGYGYDEDKLKMAIQHSDFKVLKENEGKVGFKEKSPKTKNFFREGKSGTWRKYLNEENIQDVLKHHSKVMKRLGYLDENGKILT